MFDWDITDIFSALIVAVLLFGVMVLLKGSNSFRFFKKKNHKLSFNQKQVLERQVEYYKKLNPDFKTVFESRVADFIEDKTFIARGSLPITDDMKVLVSATAIQICFGLPPMVLESFDKILIYPDAYFSTLRREYHKGETNPALGVIVLSWKDFKAGIDDPNDGLNLGIHEMAHALELENKINNDEYDFLDSALIDQWDELVKAEIESYHQGKKPIFRKYGYTNSAEFFAVAVEYFFEKPAYFHEQSPPIFAALMHLLNQDILRIYGLRTVGPT